MSKPQEEEIKETVEMLVQLDASNLVLIKSGIQLLKARQDLDTQKSA